MSNPELVSDKPVPDDPFKAVERRVWWGILIGLGLLMMTHHQLKPFLLTVAATGSALMLGFLIARILGIVLDGSTLKQWYWVGAELFVFLLLVAKQRI
ncbi:MAG: hypothetical protein JXQ97_12880 [Natronospirillum sp.]